MRVVSLRRYPVKSMGGEPLEAVEIDARGLRGDRWYAVTDGDGRLASGKSSRRFRRRDQVFDHTARTASDGVVVTGPSGEWLVGDPALASELSRVMGAPVRVAPEAGVPHQDGGSVSLVGTATLDWCAARWGLSADPRRLRVNLVVATDEPFVEDTWVGQSLAIGPVSLAVVEQVPRCRMIDLDQDGAVAEGRWLTPLTAERDGCVSVYADVQAPGTVRVGDVVRVVGPVE